MKIKPHILIIDDEQSFVQKLTKDLGKLYNVSVAYDYPSAVTMVTQIKPDVVILDIHLPDGEGYMDFYGFDICKSIRSNPKLKHTKVLMITGQATETQQQLEALKCANDHVIKTQTPRQVILARIQKLINEVKRTPNVFISHSSKDDAWIRLLAKDLKNNGFDTFVDSTNLTGGNWQHSVEEAIKQAIQMVVVLTPESVNSREVEAEWSYFLDNNKLNSKPCIFPVLLKPCEIPFRLRIYQYFDFTNDLNYDSSLQRLLAAIFDCS